MPDNYQEITVIKRDGSKQAYDPDKIIQVSEAAGLEVSQAVQLAQTINQWITNSGRNQVTSLEIRDKVLEIMDILNPQVASLFRWYQKTKD